MGGSDAPGEDVLKGDMGSESKQSSGMQGNKSLEKFDASQYAFFGGSNASEVELGALDDDEDETGIDYDLEDEGGLYDEDHEDSRLSDLPNNADLNDLTAKFSKLGENSWEETHKAADKTSAPASDIWKSGPGPQQPNQLDEWWSSKQEASFDQSAKNDVPSPTLDQAKSQTNIWWQNGYLPELNQSHEVSWDFQPSDEATKAAKPTSALSPRERDLLEAEAYHTQGKLYANAVKESGQGMVSDISTMGSMRSLSPRSPVESNQVPSFSNMVPPGPGHVPMPSNLAAAQAQNQAQAQWSQFSALQSLMTRPNAPMVHPSQIAQANQIAHARAHMQMSPHMNPSFQRLPVQVPPMGNRPYGPAGMPHGQFYPYPMNPNPAMGYNQPGMDPHSLRSNMQPHLNFIQNQASNHNGHITRSKYMSVEDIETIVRNQLAATHSSDPYVDDYYHQAVQAKLSAEAGIHQVRRHFAPTALRDLNHRVKSNSDRHSFVQIEGLGRIPLSSIRRPRPLLEVDLSEENPDGSVYRPLDQEPMLAARIAIEDGMSLLLDVDDIDRMLQMNQAPEVFSQLQKRRQALLENLASSLQLNDPLSSHFSLDPSAGRSFLSSTKDDLVFLRIASLPKGRKLITRYIRLLPPGFDLQRVVIMAIFRHLRFLFGGVQNDSESAVSLAETVAFATAQLPLKTLSACLATAALSQEQLHLQPLGIEGDGGTVILNALLDRAALLKKDQNTGPQHLESWQTAFDLFFNCLSKYLCFDQLLKSFPLPPDVTSRVCKEIPLEILRSALPHTSQTQREQVGALLQGLLRSA